MRTTTRCLLALGCLVACGAGPDSSSTEGSAPPQFGLIPGDEAVWLFTDLSADGGESALRFAFQGVAAEQVERFWPLGVPGVTGRVQHAAVRLGNLHVIFGDGSHRRYVPATVSVGQTIAPQIVTDVSLPEACVPAAFVSDRSREVLLAVIDRAKASILLEQAERKRLRKRANEPVSPESADDDAPPATELEAPLAVVRFRDASWVFDREAPEDLVEQGHIDAMLVDGEVVHLFYWHDQRAPACTYRISSGADAGWSDAWSVPIDEGERLVAVGFHEDAPRVVVASPEGVAFSLRMLNWGDGGWSQGDELRDEDNRASVFDGQFDAAIVGDRIVAGQFEQDEELWTGHWSVADGNAVFPLANVTDDVLPQRSAVDPVARMVIQSSVLVALIVVVFVWRRDSVIVPAPIRPDLQFAGLGRRLMAVLLDLAITGPLWGVAVFQIQQHFVPLTQLFGRPVYDTTELPLALFWSAVVVGVVLAVYGTITEAMTGATLGKRIASLFIVHEDGTSCSLRPIMIRNALRPVELPFLPVMLLVLLTPSRQRLGDMLARTVVVMRASELPAALEDDDSEEEDLPV